MVPTRSDRLDSPIHDLNGFRTMGSCAVSQLPIAVVSHGP